MSDLKPQSKQTIHSVCQRKMNFTTLNRTIVTCGLSFLPLNPENISPDLRAVLIVSIAINALTSPLIILLNILVMVAVKTKRQLRTKSNIVLACLATSDLLVDYLFSHCILYTQVFSSVVKGTYFAS